MECNKDEALRAKSVAESKLEQNDFAGSKKFALKAQNLYPGLDGISPMLTMLDVYISAEKKIGGLTDWYGVLGVGLSADDDAIKKQYRKLALMLHPDKNNSSGAEGAFKLISEAWSLLSDKAQRSMYNQTMGFNFKVFQHGPGPLMAQTAGPGSSTHATWAHAGGPSPCTAPRPGPSTESPLSKSTKRKPPAPKTQKKSAKSSPAGVSKAAPAPPVQTADSFWTICGQCRIQYEYNMMYRCTTLLCPTCKRPFMAAEIPRPTKSKL
ncbi:Dnaj homolog subfamily b member 12 [Phtheirospermum japonicum]|uniref:Dnaj homolog subfamily b member 12 n=1 Tax=Phtheirospermum japonicum TaxID=374723 RepID=A0A830B6Z6_9LAMI|nr:Dnaj homolog subfamily b member 12 [Phtheirospermum japonicum]